MANTLFLDVFINRNIIILIHKDEEKYFDIEYIDDKYDSIDEDYDDEGACCVFAFCRVHRRG